MKPTTGYAQPKRLARPKKQVRLNLRGRTSKPEPSGEIELEPKNTFWKWVVIVALLHVAVIVFLSIYYSMAPAPTPPPEEMISLLPPGDVVKGTPEPVQAPKLGPTTPAPSVPHHQAPPPPTPTPVAVKPKPVPTPEPTPAPIIKADKPALVPDKPPAPPKPVTPPKPKVKVDLTLQDGPTPVKPVTKPKPHKKVAPTPATNDDASDRDTADNPDSQGLSKEQIAQRLGDKLKAASGTETAVNHGTSGSTHSQANPFQEFYLSVRDQVMSKWSSPNLSDETAVTPEVTIHVEADGHTVLPENVTLTRSSGNAAYDDSALAAAKSLHYLLQPLPAGCPPDIHINFKLTR